MNINPSQQVIMLLYCYILLDKLRQGQNLSNTSIIGYNVKVLNRILLLHGWLKLEDLPYFRLSWSSKKWKRLLRSGGKVKLPIQGARLTLSGLKALHTTMGSNALNTQWRNEEQTMKKELQNGSLLRKIKSGKKVGRIGCYWVTEIQNSSIQLAKLDNTETKSISC